MSESKKTYLTSGGTLVTVIAMSPDCGVAAVEVESSTPMGGGRFGLPPAAAVKLARMLVDAAMEADFVAGNVAFGQIFPRGSWPELQDFLDEEPTPTTAPAGRVKLDKGTADAVNHARSALVGVQGSLGVMCGHVPGVIGDDIKIIEHLLVEGVPVVESKPPLTDLQRDALRTGRHLICVFDAGMQLLPAGVASEMLGKFLGVFDDMLAVRP